MNIDISTAGGAPLTPPAPPAATTQRHACPCCMCDAPERIVINVNAPFYELVVLIDTLTNDARGKHYRRKDAA